MASNYSPFLVLALFSYLTIQFFYKGGPIDTANLLQSYDYIIVGAGSAGSVLAARLSEDPEVTVLLLESGEDDGKYPDIRVPMATFSLWGNEHVSWLYKTVPQKQACQSMKENRCTWPRGRVLGGSSSINGMIYSRGHAADYDRWVAVGCMGWGYKDVLPYFIKSEKNINFKFADTVHHGSDGPQVVMDTNQTYDRPALLQAFLRGCVDIGYQEGDINDGNCMKKCMHNQVHVLYGQRQSVFDAYIRGIVAKRPNLHIRTNAHVYKVKFDGTRAIGVEVNLGRSKVVSARREVIVSAGAVNSPQLLMLSGIGPKQHLEKMKIPVVADLPVGDNLQDHLLLPVLQFTMTVNNSITAEMLQSRWARLQYFLFRTGVLSQPIGVIAHAFGESIYQNSDDPTPHIKLILSGLMTGSSEEGLDQYSNTINQDPTLQRQVFGGVFGRHGFHIFPVILHPRSRGTVRLNSARSSDPPLIDPAYLSEETDVDTMLEGIRIAQALVATKPFKDLGAELVQNRHPSCVADFDSDNYWKCVIRHMSVTEFHAVGTCRMGDIVDEKTVVGPDCKVKGTEALRVIDASVMSELISGGTNSPTVMIAEKMADAIKKETCQKT